MKKLTAILLVLVMVLTCLCACNKDPETSSEDEVSETPKTDKELFLDALSKLDIFSGDAGYSAALGNIDTSNAASHNYGVISAEFTKLLFGDTDICESGSIKLEMGVKADGVNSVGNLELSMFGDTIKGEIISVTDSSKIYMTLSDIMDEYVYLDMSEMMGEAGAASDYAELLPHLEGLVDDTADFFSNQFGDKYFSAKSGETEGSTVYTFKVTEAELYEIVVAFEAFIIGNEHVKAIYEMFAGETGSSIEEDLDIVDNDEDTAEMDGVLTFDITVTDDKVTAAKFDMTADEEGILATYSYDEEEAGMADNLTITVDGDKIFEYKRVLGENSYNMTFDGYSDGDKAVTMAISSTTADGVVDGTASLTVFEDDTTLNIGYKLYNKDGKSVIEIDEFRVDTVSYSVIVPTDVVISVSCTGELFDINMDIDVGVEGEFDVEGNINISSMPAGDTAVKAPENAVDFNEYDFESLQYELYEEYPNIMSFFDSIGGNQGSAVQYRELYDEYGNYFYIDEYGMGSMGYYAYVNDWDSKGCDIEFMHDGSELRIDFNEGDLSDGNMTIEGKEYYVDSYYDYDLECEYYDIYTYYPYEDIEEYYIVNLYYYPDYEVVYVYTDFYYEYEDYTASFDDDGTLIIYTPAGSEHKFSYAYNYDNGGYFIDGNLFYPYYE